MPLPTRSRSLRQPGFANKDCQDVQESSSRRKGTVHENSNAAEPSIKSRHHEDTSNYNRRDSQTAIMGPPGLLKRTSSRRRLEHPLHNANGGTIDPVRNPTSIYDAQHAQKDPPRSRPVLIASSLPSKPPGGAVKISNPVRPDVPRRSLHSRSQSISGPLHHVGRKNDVSLADNTSIFMALDNKAVRPGLRMPVDGHSGAKASEDTLLKPQFSTYQQHFSPRKSLKTPALSSIRRNGQLNVSNVVTADSTAHCDGKVATTSPQSSRRQDELLQLQLMHDASQARLQIYKHNTKHKLKSRFEGVVNEHITLKAQEQAYNTELCHTALQHWIDQSDSGISEKVQKLAQCIEGISNLTAPGGKISTVLDQFETWFHAMMLTLDTQWGGNNGDGGHDLFIQAMDQEWHESVTVVSRALDHFARELESLGSAKQGSTLAMVLSAHKLFIGKLQQELECATAIEKTAIEQKQSRIDGLIVHLLHQDEPQSLQNQLGDSKTGIWNCVT